MIILNIMLFMLGISAVLASVFGHDIDATILERACALSLGVFLIICGVVL